jgi:alpha-L-rhamnosidase
MRLPLAHRISFISILLLLLLTGCTFFPGSNQASVQLSGTLPEHYIWFSSSSPDRSSPRFFRKSFTIAQAPPNATLYFTGPYNFDLFVNGVLVDQLSAGGPGIVHDRPVAIVDISRLIHSGPNTVAVDASAGEIMALKIIPAAPEIVSTPLLISDGSWKGNMNAPAGWEQSAFDDSAWPAVTQLNGIEFDSRNFEWNLDLGLYQWPGYQGSNRLLEHAELLPKSSTQIGPHTWLLDFGREITGQLQAASKAQEPLHLSLTHGESEEEALSDASFLGTRPLIVPAGQTARGPLTAFRFVRVNFDDAAASGLVVFDADEVSAGLTAQGSFHCSDELLNRIWETSVYTAQLGIQTTFWDAPKRDRKPFAGDLFVTARTVRVAFGDNDAIRKTLSELLRREFILQNTFTTVDINNISSYDAYWVLDLFDEYQFSGDINYLNENRGDLVQVLEIMRTEVNSQHLFVNTNGALVFADWSPGMLQFAQIKGPDALAITTMAFAMAFDAGAQLLRELGENSRADSYFVVGAAMRDAAMANYLDIATGTLGPRMQTNAMAVVSGTVDTQTGQRIYDSILSRPPSAPVSPYFNYFVVSAMADTGHREEALSLIRQVWGSMLDRDATTFWEMYDPKCVTAVNFHSCLVDYQNSFDPQGSNSLFVSLAHGWSSGPAPWLSQEILGIRSTSPGFRSALIRPDLAGLQWAQGIVPTPLGPILISIESGGALVNLEVPLGIEVTVSMPAVAGKSVVIINDSAVQGVLTEGGTRTEVRICAGQHVIQSF